MPNNDNDNSPSISPPPATTSQANKKKEEKESSFIEPTRWERRWEDENWRRTCQSKWNGTSVGASTKAPSSIENRTKNLYFEFLRKRTRNGEKSFLNNFPLQYEIYVLLRNDNISHSVIFLLLLFSVSFFLLLLLFVRFGFGVGTIFHTTIHMRVTMAAIA